MPYSSANLPVRSSHALKANATVLVYKKPATYLPPILCGTCDKADLPALLRPQGFTVNDLKEAKARTNELIWDLDTVRQSATQCRLCQMLLKCLEKCEGFDTPGTSDIFVQLDPIAEYQEMGELTWWMPIVGKSPKPTMGEFIRCQLRVGLRMRQDIDGLDPVITHERSSCLGNSDISPQISQQGDSLEITRPSPSVSLPIDHPTPTRVGTGFISSDPAREPLYPTCDRELSHTPGHLWRSTVLETRFDRLTNKVRDLFSAPAGSSQETVGSGLALSYPAEHTSSLSIQLMRMRPKGLIDGQYVLPSAGLKLNPL